MKKKMLSGLLAVAALSFALTACGGDKGTEGAAASSGDAKEIKITATNFQFDQKEIHVKKGEKIKLTLDNKQGMHGIAIPDLKVDVKSAGSAEFVADKTGTFEFHCSVMCGAGHADMKGTLIVE